jgi:hypothetical protein
MAKKKSKKKASPKPKPKMTMDPQKTLSVLVPDNIAALHPDQLKSLAHVMAHGGELGLAQPPHAAVHHVQFIKTSAVAQPMPAALWPKSILDGC